MTCRTYRCHRTTSDGRRLCDECASRPLVTCLRCAGTGRKGWDTTPQTDEYDRCPTCGGAAVVRA